MKSLAAVLHARLVEPGDDACTDLDAAACTAVPANFLRTLLAGFFTKLGDALTSPKVTLAWLFGAVGAPAALVGLLVPIRESGSLLPQLLIADFVQRHAVRKWIWVGGAVLQAAAIAAIGLAAFLLEDVAAGWTMLGLLVVFSLARACSSIAAKDVLGKTIPQAQRGQVTGWAASAAGLVTLAVGGLLVCCLGREAGAAFYALLLVVAACLWLLAALVYARMREPDSAREQSAGLLQAATERLGLLVRDRVLRRFVIARGLLLCSGLSAPFYVSLAQEAQGTAVQLLGTFIIAEGLAALLSGPLWGRLADRSSRHVMMLATALAAGLGVSVFVVATLAADALALPWLLPLLYFLLGIAHHGVRVGRKTYVVDIAAGNQRTDYVAVSNTAIGVILLMTGLLGALVAVLSVPLVVLALSLLGLVGVWMVRQLPEPCE